MPIHLYCLLSTSAEAPPPGLRGVEGALVEALRIGDVTAWVSECNALRATPGIVAAREHDAVNAAALATGSTPLPVRFGQRFDSRAQCLERLGTRTASVRAALDRVAGMVEMGIRAELTGPREVPATVAAGEGGASPGRSYLQRLQGRLNMERFVQRQAQPILQRLSAAVGPHIRRETIAFHTSPAPTLVVSHLVAREAVSSYRMAVSVLHAEREVRVLVVTGPFAPYSFVVLE